MSAENHALDEGSPWNIGTIYLALAVVVASNEEGNLGTIFIQKVEKVTSVLVGSVIVG